MITSVAIAAFLTLFPSCICSEIELVETGGGIKTPGDAFHLTCTVSGFSITDYGVNWIRQLTGKAPQWMGIQWGGGSIDYNPDLRSRITITREPAKSQSYLRVNDASEHDSGTYYCASLGLYWFDVWGNGTPVLVSSASPSAPVLFPLIPIGSGDGGKIAIGCLAKDFLPDSITFAWNDQKNATIDVSNIKSFPSISAASGTFMASSQTEVSYTDWKTRSPFYCKAKHSSGDREIPVRACSSEPLCPIDMAVRAPPVKAFSSAYLNSTITCEALGLDTQQTTLKWYRNDELLESGFQTTKPTLNSQGICYNMRSKLIVTKEDWLSGVKFYCEVQNSKYNNTLVISLDELCSGVSGPCDGDDIRVDTIAPTYADIYQTSSAKLICRISNIPYSQQLSELNATWTQEPGHKILNTEYSKPTDQGNGMQYIDATATVCATEWRSGQTFNCKVNFPGALPKPVEKKLKKTISGTPHIPAVYVLPPPSDQLTLRESASLTCLLKNFNPPDFFVKWLHNDQPVSSVHYFTSQPKQELKQSEGYFAYSMLNINEQDWNSGDSYTCVVGHETLPFNTTQKTIDKNTGKPSIVNVSLMLADTGTTCY